MAGTEFAAQTVATALALRRRRRRRALRDAGARAALPALRRQRRVAGRQRGAALRLHARAVPAGGRTRRFRRASAASACTSASARRSRAPTATRATEDRAAELASHFEQRPRLCARAALSHRPRPRGPGSASPDARPIGLPRGRDRPAASAARRGRAPPPRARAAPGAGTDAERPAWLRVRTSCVDNCERAYELCAQVGTPEQLLPDPLRARATRMPIRADAARAPALIRELNAVAGRLGTVEYRALAQNLVARSIVTVRRIRRGVPSSSRDRWRNTPARNPGRFGGYGVDPVIGINLTYAMALWFLGSPIARPRSSAKPSPTQHVRGSRPSRKRRRLDTRR